MSVTLVSHAGNIFSYVGSIFSHVGIIFWYVGSIFSYDVDLYFSYVGNGKKPPLVNIPWSFF